MFYDSIKNKISLTGSHLIYVLSKGYIKASEVRIGDKLRTFSVNDKAFKEFEVKQIDFQIKEGFIAPLTDHGTILVNGIDASCYADINNQNLADIAMLPVRLWYKISKWINWTSNNEDKEFIGVSKYFNFLHVFTYNVFPYLLK